MKISRREAIKNTALILGVSLPLSHLKSAMSVFEIDEIDYKAGFFARKNYILLTRIADLIIPRTDTAGAADIGVHRFIDTMLSEWASVKTQEKYRSGLNSIDKLAIDSHRKSFIDCSVDEQTKILTGLDDHPEKNAQSNFFSELKWFVISGYYTSEYGGSVELRYDPMPGQYRGCTTLNEDDRVWST